MSNSKELKVKYHGNKEKKSRGRKKNPNVASMSALGYGDGSPYRSLPYIDIDTPSGRIDMSNTGIPLWANGRILPPYSGIHQFDSETVREIPLAQKGLTVLGRIDNWIDNAGKNVGKAITNSTNALLDTGIDQIPHVPMGKAFTNIFLEGRPLNAISNLLKIPGGVAADFGLNVAQDYIEALENKYLPHTTDKTLDLAHEGLLTKIGLEIAKNKNLPGITEAPKQLGITQKDFNEYLLQNKDRILYKGVSYDTLLKELAKKYKKQKGGSLPMAQDGTEMPFGMPLKEVNPFTVAEYRQPMMGKFILPDPNRPELLNTGATEYKMGISTDKGELQIPLIVSGQYLGPRNAVQRTLRTREVFRPMADPSSYSKFYNMVNQLGIMQQKDGGSLAVAQTGRELYEQSNNLSGRSFLFSEFPLEYTEDYRFYISQGESPKEAKRRAKENRDFYIRAFTVNGISPIGFNIDNKRPFPNSDDGTEMDFAPVYPKPIEKLIDIKPRELKQVDLPQLQPVARPVPPAPEFVNFTAAGQPMVDVRTGETTEVPMGYRIVTDEKGIRRLSEKEKNYRLNKKQKGGWLGKYQGGKEVLSVDPQTGLPVKNLEGVEITASKPINGKNISLWLNPMNWGVPDFTDKYKTWDEAYVAAKKQGLKEIIWNKGPSPGRKNLDYAGTVEEEAKTYFPQYSIITGIEPGDYSKIIMYESGLNQFFRNLLELPESANQWILDRFGYDHNTNQYDYWVPDLKIPHAFAADIKNKRIIDWPTGTPMERFGVDAYDDTKYYASDPSIAAEETFQNVYRDISNKNFGSYDPRNNNCADAVCEGLELPYRLIYTKPSEIPAKLKSKYPTIELTSNKTNAKEKQEILYKEGFDSGDLKIIEKYKHDRNFIMEIQGKLYSMGYEVTKYVKDPSSSEQIPIFDGIYGDEIKNAVLALTKQGSHSTPKWIGDRIQGKRSSYLVGGSKLPMHQTAPGETGFIGPEEETKSAVVRQIGVDAEGNPIQRPTTGYYLPTIDITAEKEDTYNNYMADKYRDAGLGEALFMAPLDYVFGYPQAAMTKLFSGKYQLPSEAMGIENPIGAIAADILFDPTNLLGAGLFAKSKGLLRKGALSKSNLAAKSAGRELSPSEYTIIADNGLLYGTNKKTAKEQINKFKNYLNETYDFDNMTPYQREQLLDREAGTMLVKKITIDDRIANNKRLLEYWDEYKKDRIDYFNSPKYRERVNKQYGEMDDEFFENFKGSLLENLENRPYLRPDLISGTTRGAYVQGDVIPDQLYWDQMKPGHTYYPDKTLSKDFDAAKRTVFHEGRHQLTDAKDQTYFFPSEATIKNNLIHQDLIKTDPDLTRLIGPEKILGSEYYLSPEEFVVRLDELKRELGKVGYDYKTMDLTPEILKKYKGLTTREAVEKVAGKNVKVADLTPEQNEAIGELLQSNPKRTKDTDRLLRWFNEDFLLDNINNKWALFPFLLGGIGLAGSGAGGGTQQQKKGGSKLKKAQTGQQVFDTSRTYLPVPPNTFLPESVYFESQTAQDQPTTILVPSIESISEIRAPRLNGLIKTPSLNVNTQGIIDKMVPVEEGSTTLENTGIEVSPNKRVYDKKSSDGRTIVEKKWDKRKTKITGVTKEAEPFRQNAQDFLKSMAAHAPDIQADFGLTDKEMEELMRVSFGLFGKESSFAQGPRWAAKLLGRKGLRGIKDIMPDQLPEGDEMSEGAGQIKVDSFFDSPEKRNLLKKYGIDKDNIWDVKNAALALMLSNAINYKEFSFHTGADFQNADNITLRNVLAKIHNKGLVNVLNNEFSKKINISERSGSEKLADLLRLKKGWREDYNTAYQTDWDTIVEGMKTYSNLHTKKGSYTSDFLDYTESLDIDYNKIKQNRQNSALFEPAAENIPDALNPLNFFFPNMINAEVSNLFPYIMDYKKGGQKKGWLAKYDTLPKAQKGLSLKDIPSADNKKIVIDNYSDKYDYVMEGNRLYFSPKGQNSYALSNSDDAKFNILSFINGNNYWAGYGDTEKKLYKVLFDKKPGLQFEAAKPEPLITQADMAIQQRREKIRKEQEEQKKKTAPPKTLEQAYPSEFEKKRNALAKQPDASQQKTDFDFDMMNNKYLKEADQRIRDLQNFSIANSMQRQRQELEEYGNSIMGKIAQGIEGFTEDASELYDLGMRWLDRIKVTKLGMEGDDVEVPTTPKKRDPLEPLTVEEYYDQKEDPYGSKIDYVLDAPANERGFQNTGRTYKQQDLNANTIKWGIRNRGDLTPFKSDGIEITLFNPFGTEKYADNTSVIAVNPEGKLETGTYKDFKDKRGYKWSNTFMNKVTDFVLDETGKQVYKQDKDNRGFYEPVVKVTGDSKGRTTGVINTLVKDPRNENKYGSVEGGRVLFVNPVTKQMRVVAGSAAHIRKKFYEIKGDAPYLEVYVQDNGTYSRGLSFKDRNFTSDRLKSYDNAHSKTGATGLYIVDYEKEPSSKFKVQYHKGMPNVRTKKDDSYKKGHALKNEVKKVVLHHTAYTGPDATKGVHRQFMTPNQASAHILIDYDGTRHIYASPEQVTFHAGASEWEGRKNLNDFSIGVEFQGDTTKTPLTDAQIDSFLEYYRSIAKTYGLKLKDVVTHHMVSGPRKPDIVDRDYKRLMKRAKELGFE